jgi:thioredoxin-related protein
MGALSVEGTAVLPDAGWPAENRYMATDRRRGHRIIQAGSWIFKQEMYAGAVKRACLTWHLPIYSPGDINTGKEPHMAFRKTTLIMIAAAMLAGCGGGEMEPVEKTEKTVVPNTWLSFDSGMELARDMSKPVVIDFYTSWCGWCKKMDKMTFKNEEVDSYLSEHFISIKLNAEQKNTKIQYGGRSYTPASLVRAFKVRGYPSVAYLDEKGALIFVDTGFKDAGQFMVNLKYVKSGCHRKGVSIEEFRRNGGKCD